MRVTRVLNGEFAEVHGVDGELVKPEEIEQSLRDKLHLDALTVTAPNGVRVTARISFEAHLDGHEHLWVNLATETEPVVEGQNEDDWVTFKSHFSALEHVQERLRLAARDLENHLWKGKHPYGGATDYPLEQLLSHEPRRGDRHGVTLEVPDEVQAGLGPAMGATYALGVMSRCSPETFVAEYPDDRTLRVSENVSGGTSAFHPLMRELFRQFMPDRVPTGSRTTKLTGTLARVRAAEKASQGLGWSAVMLVVGLLITWVLPLTAVSLVGWWVWWAVALLVAARFRVTSEAVGWAKARDVLGKTLGSFAGLGMAFLSLVTFFALLYGTVRVSDTGLLDYPTHWTDGGPTLGEMGLVSLGVAASAGSFDVTLNGVARFIALLELLVFYGTIAGVLGALSRRLLFDRDVAISADMTIFNGLDDDDAL